MQYRFTQTILHSQSYSSFANTNGGLIVFGVNEGVTDNEIVGVEDSQKIVSDLWNLLSNESKVSYRTVNNQDVTTAVIDDKTVILYNGPLVKTTF